MRIFIIQSEIDVAKTLSEIFHQRGDHVLYSTDDSEIRSLLEQEYPDVAVIDLHLPEEILTDTLKHIQNNYPSTKILITSRYPNLTRELQVMEYGINTFVRSPFTKVWVERALQRLESLDIEAEEANKNLQSVLPKVRIPVRIKIILPYMLLSLLLAMGAGYIVSRIALDTIEERFINNLLEVGLLASARMVEEENTRLETLRLLAYTEGIDEFIIAQDSEALRELSLGVAVNSNEEAIEIIDAQGAALLSMYHWPGGGPEAYDYSKGSQQLSDLDFIQQVLNQNADELGDKFAGLAQTPKGDYLFISGPVFDQENQLIGAILIGRSVTTIVQETRTNLLGEENIYANITIYDKAGQPLATTLLETDLTKIMLPPGDVTEIMDRQEKESYLRHLTVFGIDYREVVGAWEVRGGHDIGFIGVSLAEQFLVRPSRVTQNQIYAIATAGVFLIIIIGVMLAQRITRPLNKVVTAASEVSQGKLDVSVDTQGSDELAFLGYAFNYMISHLREGEVYRDLLGRTITPQVRDQLRQVLASGDLRLDGQNTVASVLITDIHKFTVIADKKTPTTILRWLNQYYGEMVPVVTKNNGVNHEFVGDSLMAFFGILPIPLSPQESAFQACKAAVGILNAITTMNEKRTENGEPPLVTGIGINTGVVATGGMGTPDRLHYAVIGDTVNVTQRIQDLTRSIGETSAIIGQDTFEALGQYREPFHFTPLGKHTVKGKAEPIEVYRLLPLDVDEGE